MDGGGAPFTRLHGFSPPSRDSAVSQQLLSQSWLKMAGIMAYLVKQPDGHTELKLTLTKDPRGQSIATIPVATIPTKPPPVATIPTKPRPVAAIPTKPSPVAAIPTKPPPVAAIPTKPPPVAAIPTKLPPVAAIPTKPPPVNPAPGTSTVASSASERAAGTSGSAAPKVTSSAAGALPPKRQQVILPVSRIKTIMKTNVKSSQSSLNIGQDSVMVIAKATELFIAKLAQESYRVAEEESKREVVYKHLSTAVRRESQQMRFLFDILPEKVLVKDYLESLHQDDDEDL